MGRLSDTYLGNEPYPESPGFTDGNTSREAAERVAPGASEVREQCYRAILASRDGLTADEVAQVVGRPILYVRPRISELYAAGRLVKTLRRKTNASGLSAAIYDIPREQLELL